MNARISIAKVSFIRLSRESNSSGALSKIFAIFALVLSRMRSIISFIKSLYASIAVGVFLPIAVGPGFLIKISACRWRPLLLIGF